MPTAGVMGIPATGQAVAGLVSPETVKSIDSEAQRESIAWELGGDQSLGLLVRDRYGDEVVDRCVSALLGGVYSCAADDLGVRATVPALANALDELVREGRPVTLSAAVAKVLAAGEKPHRRRLLVGRSPPRFSALSATGMPLCMSGWRRLLMLRSTWKLL